MKKAWIFLIVVALLALSVPVFADGPTVKADINLQAYANYNTNGAGGEKFLGGGVERNWDSLDVSWDKNNDLLIQLRGPLGSSTFDVHQFAWVSNLTASAGLDLPFAIKLTAGWFEEDMTNWWYAETNAFEFYYGGARYYNNYSAAQATAAYAGKAFTAPNPNTNWNNMLLTSEVGSGTPGYLIDVTTGIVNLHYYQNINFQDTILAADASFMGFGLLVGYAVYGDGNGLYPAQTGEIGKGDLSIEAKYEIPQMGDLTAGIYPYFRYGLSDQNDTYGVSLKVGYSMFHVAAGLQGDNSAAVDHISGEVWVNPIPAARIFVGAYFNNSSAFASQNQVSSLLQAVDINVSYMFGTYVNLMVGYIVPGTDKLAIPIVSDNGVAMSAGPYFGVSVNF